jgi:hypothetical protein
LRQKLRLVVTSLASSVVVERDGHEDRRVLKVGPTDRGPQAAEEFSQFSTQPFAMVKLQLQDSGAKLSGVEVEAARQVERIFLAAALGAEGITRFQGALTGKENATSGAKGALRGSKAVPAVPANASSVQPVELLAAQGAVRWKESS